MEMVRMANVYMHEGNFENSYILYMKFMILFLEKITSHPDYKTVPAELKKPNQAKLKEILPITEHLKVKLITRYEKEYTQYLADRKAEKEKEAQRAKELALKAQQEKNRPAITVMPVLLPTAPALDDVVYPNDFPTEPSRSSKLPPGLILPDQPKPSFDRTLKPSPSSFLEGLLRHVIVPESILEKFLKVAQSNTNANVETCGILAGRLAQNKLIISHVILPKQSGTADSCNTMNEEEIFDIQDQHNLITLGWIHTHPSQTAFLSSVDLHTHCSYQLMMAEAIAIVCSPKYQT
jgi:STAM-binding protein